MLTGLMNNFVFICWVVGDGNPIFKRGEERQNIKEGCWEMV